MTVVAILNFKFEHYGDWPQEKCHSSYRLREDGTGEIMTEFSNLFLLAKINNFTSDELKQYQKSLENMGEFENIINSTEERAREAGRAEGRAEIAVKMLSAGFSLDQIAQLTGLEISDIEKLNL